MASQKTNLILNISQRLQSLQKAHQRGLIQRTEEHSGIKHAIKKTAWYVVGTMVFVAGISDILSLADFGWVTSWLIPIFSWFMVLKINAIMRQSPHIVAATGRLTKEERLVRQRLMTLLPPIERAKLGAQTYVGDAIAGARSYVTTWIRDSIITQVIELIPVVDMLPLYLGQVIKMIVNQNIEYQKVQKLMPAYERGLSVLDSLEKKEIEFLNQQLTTLLNSRPPEALQRVVRGGAPVRDIAQSQPTPLRPRPGQTGQPPSTPPRQPMRDIQLPGVAMPAAA